MPRVATRTVKKQRHCQRCPEPILPGQQAYIWKFRYGGERAQHTEHGPPKRSQLTLSAMGEVYAAIEAAEEAGDDLGAFAEAIQAVADTAQEVAGQYEEAAMAFNSSGENQERYELLSEWADTVADAAGELESAAQALDNARSALDECPL
jgi:hypothetical protein